MVNKNKKVKIHEITFHKGAQIVFAGILLGFLLSFFLVKVVFAPKSSATIYLHFSTFENGEETTFSDFFTSINLSESFAEYMDADFILERAAEALKSHRESLSKEYSYKDLKKAIHVEFAKQSLLIQLKVTAANLDDSNYICKFYSKFAPEQIIDLCQAGYYRTLNSSPSENANQDSNDGLTIILCGTLIGMILSVLIVIIYIRFSRKIINDAQLLRSFQKYLIIGEIPCIAKTPENPTKKKTE